MPMRPATGPFTTTIGPENQVVARRPCMLNSSVQAASTAASTTGRYSGRQPAITALTATFSTVHGTRSGGTTATGSSGSRSVPSSMRSTRAGVGGTTGRPSVQPRSYMASISSSSSATWIRRLARRWPSKRTRSSSVRVGSTDSEPQPGRYSGQSLAQVGTAGERPPGVAVPPLQAGRLHAPVQAEQRGHGIDAQEVRAGQVGVVHGAGQAVRERRVVLGEHRAPVLAGEGGHHLRHHGAGGAVTLEDRHQAVRQAVLRPRFGGRGRLRGHRGTLPVPRTTMGGEISVTLEAKGKTVHLLFTHPDGR